MEILLNPYTKNKLYSLALKKREIENEIQEVLNLVVDATGNHKVGVKIDISNDFSKLILTDSDKPDKIK